MNKKEKLAREQSAIAELKELIKPNDTIYTSLQNVSSNGMSRRIAVYIIQESKQDKTSFIRDISWLVANACGFRYNEKHGALVVGGCGMDMGYHVAYSITGVLNIRKTYQDNTGGEIGNCYGINHKWL